MWNSVILGKNPHDVQAFVKKHVTAEQRRRPLSEARPARSRRVRLPGGGRRRLGRLWQFLRGLDVSTDPSFEYLGLLIGLLSIMLRLRKQGSLRRGHAGGPASQWGSQRVHIYEGSWPLETVTVVTSKIPDHR